jgi:leucyl aminopeptidase
MKARVLKGDELLEAGYRPIHAVGRRRTRPPCLIDLAWGEPKQSWARGGLRFGRWSRACSW